jgi:hypothetical protein
MEALMTTLSTGRFSRSTLDQATRRVTAFATSLELEAACLGGYTPTIRVDATDDDRDANAKLVLIEWLRGAGLRTFA